MTAPLVPVRHRVVAGRVLLSNPWGDWLSLTADEFEALQREAPLPPSLEARLAERNFLRDRVDVHALAERVRRRTGFLQHGPNLHILVVTLRCNETCVYCHASRADLGRTDTDMPLDVVERAVDLALASTSPSITLEFQGGEPLANFPAVRHAVQYALGHPRARGRTLGFTLVSNLSLMTEEMLDFLIEHRVQVCTSVDGPRALHDRQRRLPGGSAWDATVGWSARVNARYAALGLDPEVYHVEALVTTTREALERPAELVDAYVSLGCRAIFLRPMDPFGFASKAQGRVGYRPEEFVAFYRAALDHILALNRQGVQILERLAALLLTKILAGEEPNYLDLRSPCGAGIGQVAYDHDGRIYTCDEGRMLAASGDALFQIGVAGRTTYRELVGHPTVRAMALASNLDASPDCSRCVYRPWCGVCPVVNYATQGSLHGRMRESAWCAVQLGVQDWIFEQLAEGDPETLAIFERWTAVRDRSHFLHYSKGLESESGTNSSQP